MLTSTTVYHPRHARKYAETIASLKAGEWAEALKINVLSYGFRWLGNKKLSAVDTPDFVAWRDARLKVISAPVMRAVQYLLR